MSNAEPIAEDMITMKITLDCFDDLPIGADLHDVRIVLMDALAEYVSHRANGNGAEYVAKRYPDETVYAGKSRDEKIESVNRRCKVAKCLHSFILE